jgi:hypothetical protein
MNKDIQPAIDMLRAKHTIDNPATIEDMAAACGIDVNAPFSYRDVLDLSEAIAMSPHVIRFWVGGERRYFATPEPETTATRWP